jgi:hypothetical protein
MGNQQPTALTSEARRQKQLALMIEPVERKIRARAQQLYEERGHVEGFAVADWVQAEAEVLQKSILAPLYRRSRQQPKQSEGFLSEAMAGLVAPEAAASESRT